MVEYKPRADTPAAPHPSGDAQRLRHDIDSGRTGDKIPVEDPAAAPLGTDDEAAGTRPASAPARDGAPHPAPPGHARGDENGPVRGLGVAMVSMLAVIVAVVAVVMVAT